MNRIVRISAICLLVCLLAVAAGAATALYEGIGKATFTPNVVTTLTDAPDAGVAMPAATRAIEITVETNPIRYWTTGDDPTATAGLVLYAGTTLFQDDPNWINGFKFIDTSAGASTVQVEFRKRVR